MFFVLLLKHGRDLPFTPASLQIISHSYEVSSLFLVVDAETDAVASLILALNHNGR